MREQRFRLQLLIYRLYNFMTKKVMSDERNMMGNVNFILRGSFNMQEYSALSLYLLRSLPKYAHIGKVNGNQYFELAQPLSAVVSGVSS